MNEEVWKHYFHRQKYMGWVNEDGSEKETTNWSLIKPVAVHSKFSDLYR